MTILAGKAISRITLIRCGILVSDLHLPFWCESLHCTTLMQWLYPSLFMACWCHESRDYRHIACFMLFWISYCLGECAVRWSFIVNLGHLMTLQSALAVMEYTFPDTVCLDMRIDSRFWFVAAQRMQAATEEEIWLRIPARYLLQYEVQFPLQLERKLSTSISLLLLCVSHQTCNVGIQIAYISFYLSILSFAKVILVQ